MVYFNAFSNNICQHSYNIIIIIIYLFIQANLVSKKNAVVNQGPVINI
jgi:hypothetical protein